MGFLSWIQNKIIQPVFGGIFGGNTKTGQALIKAGASYVKGPNNESPSNVIDGALNFVKGGYKTFQSDLVKVGQKGIDTVKEVESKLGSIPLIGKVLEEKAKQLTAAPLAIAEEGLEMIKAPEKIAEEAFNAAREDTGVVGRIARTPMVSDAVNERLNTRRDIIGRGAGDLATNEEFRRLSGAAAAL